jgi:hypothetical protein
MTTRRLLLWLSLIFSTATTVSSRPPKELAECQSWAASAALIGERWTHDALPTTFAARALEHAGTNLGRDAKTLAARKTPPSTEIIAQLLQIRERIVQLQTAIRQGDRTRCRQWTAALLMDEQRLRVLTSSSFSTS